MIYAYKTQDIASCKTLYYAQDGAHALHLARNIIRNINYRKDPQVSFVLSPCWYFYKKGIAWKIKNGRYTSMHSD